ncbi:glycosyltransferase family 2 protein [Cohnella candidum]|uniref:Glycosyltransferase family 2 protein n=1 Tax=Cohnella candidum TaxID=2674991 RepID=A0A3G3K171_9BACL|nr:glycosyltransferase family 2 protein [Cohnella candidum]AYQ74172.1 glycosyltransferase family 2 protein [Cohnella candidum]
MIKEHSLSKLTVSVIIPTWNAGQELKDLIQSLWAQTLVPAQIIVVDSSSTDGTAELAKSLGATVFSIEQEEFDHGGTRNYAAEQAVGDILMFMTQDAIPAGEKLIENLINPLTDPNVCCSYARQIAKPNANLLEQLSREYNYPSISLKKSAKDIASLGIKAFFCSNVCSAMRKETFRELGQFPAPVIFNEDMFFAAKGILAGYSVFYAAEAVVLHSHNYSLMQQFKRFFDNGVSMRMNEGFMPYSSVGKTGTNLLKIQLRGIVEKRAWRWFAVLFLDLTMKFFGLQFGKRYYMLPIYIRKRFSMHQKIWVKIIRDSGAFTNAMK